MDTKKKKQGHDIDQVDEIVKKMEENGLICGQNIAESAKILHPDALLIVPLYRSCIVVEQNDQDKKDGACKIHSYGDPHYLGRDINADNLKGLHSYYKVQGIREGPEIVKMKILPLKLFAITKMG